MTKRRRFSGELKAKVALEALRGDRTLQEIALKHQVHESSPFRSHARSCFVPTGAGNQDIAGRPESVTMI